VLINNHYPGVDFASPGPLKMRRHQLNLWGMSEKLHKKVSPPFEGGVVGTFDYLIYTVFSFPTGVVDSLITSYQDNKV
jgi:hypothetical protein